MTFEYDSLIKQERIRNRSRKSQVSILHPRKIAKKKKLSPWPSPTQSEAGHWVYDFSADALRLRPIRIREQTTLETPPGKSVRSDSNRIHSFLQCSRLPNLLFEKQFWEVVSNRFNEYQQNGETYDCPSETKHPGLLRTFRKQWALMQL